MDIRNALKQEPKLEPNDNDLQAITSRSNVNELVSAADPNRRELFRIRHRIQKIHASTQQTGLLSPLLAVELRDYMLDLAIFPWGPDDYTVTKIAKAVKLVTDETMFGDIAKKAAILIQNWKEGHFAPMDLDAGEGVLISDENSSGEENDAQRSRKVRRLRGGPTEHIIQNLVTSLLQGITISRSSSTSTGILKLSPTYTKRPADHFGHNTLSVGDWWPRQQPFLIRDGAHGSAQGGIHGRLSYGAFSIVLSGGIYDDIDSDQGARILYSGSKGPTPPGSPNPNLNRTPVPTSSTRYLIISQQTGQPVRLFRAAKGKGRWAPSHGIRYDGLYTVLSHTVKIDETGRGIYRFELVRREGQPPIDTSRPSREEVEAWWRVKEMQ